MFYENGLYEIRPLISYYIYYFPVTKLQMLYRITSNDTTKKRSTQGGKTYTTLTFIGMMQFNDAWIRPVNAYFGTILKLSSQNMLTHFP